LRIRQLPPEHLGAQITPEWQGTMIGRMHILFVCHEYPPLVSGGIGTAVATLARAIVRAGHSASVIGFYAAPSREVDEGVRVYRLPYPRPWRFIGTLMARRSLREQIKQIHIRDKIDVVEWPDYEGWFFRPLRGVTDVVKVHGTYLSSRHHGFAKGPRRTELMELQTLYRIRNWIGVSYWFNDDCKSLTSARPLRETIVYNPVDTALFPPNVGEREPGLVLYVGGLKRRKGVLELAQAASKFLTGSSAARLRLIGHDADISKEEFLKAAGAGANKVEFRPFASQSEISAQMRNASVYAMPSLWESCGNSWIEAMSCGTPVLGSTMSCGPEIIEGGHTGLLADPKNSDDVADKVTLLINNTALARQFGLNGIKRVREQFSSEVGALRSLSFYRDCISRKSLSSVTRGPVR